MALNIKELIALANRLDSEGRHKEADELDEMIQKLSGERDWESLSPVEQKEITERQDWHQDPIGFVSKRSPPYKDPTPEEIFQQEEGEPKHTGAPGMLQEDLTGKLVGMEVGEEESAEAAKEIVDQFVAEGYDDERAKRMAATKIYRSFENALQEIGISPQAFKETLMGPGGLIMEEDESGRFTTKKESAQKLAGVEEQPTSLPPYQPGLFDLESQHRLQPIKEEIERELKVFFDDPSKESAENIHTKILEYIENKGKDEGTASDIERIEQEKGVKWSETQKVFEKLADIADRLDKLGATEEAGLIDGFIEKHAEDADDVLDYQGEDEKGEQSKRYDSEHHHSLQVREPKTKQERIDREGREKHHVHTMQPVGAGSLNTRYCPEHVGVMVGRVGELTYQCPLDGAIFNYETGWTDHDGKEHPGGSVAAQTPDSSGYAIPHRIFDSRENILNRVN